MSAEPSPEHLRALILASQTIAVLGAHADRGRAAHYVPAYMAENGCRVVAVNPTLAGGGLFGEPALARLAELSAPVDMVLVFRRSECLMDHVPEILAMAPRPAVVWFQLGIRNDGAAAALRAAGIDVVQDRCLMVDHRRLVGARG
ncbi:MAG: CoA-binding protein [Nannocystaceae bacterium]